MRSDAALRVRLFQPWDYAVPSSAPEQRESPAQQSGSDSIFEVQWCKSTRSAAAERRNSL